MKEQAKKAAPYANVAFWESALMALDEWLKTDFTRTQLAFLGVVLAGSTHLFLAYGVPLLGIIYRGVRKRLLAWAGIMLLCLIPVAVDASEARLVADCAEEVEVLNGKTNEIEKECKRERVYFDMGIRFGGIAFKLNRPREILAGFDAGTGYGMRWRPDWWGFTPAFLSIDLFANAGYLAREGMDDAVTVGALLVLSLFDWIGLGGGINHAFGLGNSPDETTWIGTFGLSKSI